MQLRAQQSWGLWSHTSDDFCSADTIVSEIRRGRKRCERSGSENYRYADADFGFAEALQAGKNGTRGPLSNELKIKRTEKYQQIEEERLGGNHRAVGSSVHRFEPADVGESQHQSRRIEHVITTQTQ